MPKPKAEKPKALKPEWEVFCQRFVTHGNASKQYQASYPDSSPDAARSSAATLLANPIIQARVAELRAELRQAFAMEREDLLATLFRCINASPEEASADNPLCEISVTKEGPIYTFPPMLGCIQEANRMMGNHAAAKHDHTSSDGSMSPARIERVVVDPKESEG